MINELKKEFIGIGEVKGFKFIQITNGEHAFLYKVFISDTIYHYEVFKRKNTPLCIDFENKVFSETEFKEIYPKSNAFGVWAWTHKDHIKAIDKYNQTNIPV